MKNVGGPRVAASASVSAICSEAHLQDPRKDDGR
jgi:hypothetical protein